ncbi:MAG: hypothetical protein WD768_21360 [Phycisphaeraceae bacterium]
MELKALANRPVQDLGNPGTVPRTLLGYNQFAMTQALQIVLELPDDLARLRLPEGVQNRLDALLDRQDRGLALTDGEREEAEGLVNLSELLSLLKLRSERLGNGASAE